MNKRALCVFVLAVAACVIAAAAQEELEVLSLNTIGYIKQELPAQGDLITVSVPLSSMVTVENVFSNLAVAAEAKQGSRVSFWDATGQAWVSGNKEKAGWPANIRSRVVSPGEAFFIRGATTASDPVEITITGEVPPDESIARSISGNMNYDFMSNPYPTEFVFGESSLAISAPSGARVAFWDADNQEWVARNKEKAGWPAAASNYVVGATEGFFYRQGGASTTWNPPKPYTWP